MSRPISISLKDLTNHPETLREEIESGLGSKDGALGIIVIKDLPLEFHHLRQKLLKLGYILANLPEEQQRGLERPETSYLFGWSHGKEVMNGRPDFQKGSFYANPLYDGPDADLKDAHPEYYAGNNWPSGIPELREFEETFKSLGKIIFDVGCHLAKACEAFVSENVDGVHVDSIEKLISQSQCNKARLLHYYPIAPTEQNVDSSHDALCGTHLDHSLLTGLCSAMYLTPTPTGTEETSGPPESGLWIYPRSSTDAVKVSIPKDCLAFQTGEALQVLTGGKLAATPHYVSGNMPNGSEQISRETFAFFLQPNVNAVIGADGETFGQFTKRVIQRHYADR